MTEAELFLKVILVAIGGLMISHEYGIPTGCAVTMFGLALCI